MYVAENKTNDSVVMCLSGVRPVRMPATAPLGGLLPPGGLASQ